MLCYTNNTHIFEKVGTVPPKCPLGFQLFFGLWEKGQITPNMGKHTEKQELETVPPQELGIVPPLGGKKWPLRWDNF